ncbi:Uncharacterised protein [Mycobacteroides abscessus subsp. abscessus]|nr:Uncharacterised protein [Mycobacteroides abscessus subsp. abscessus]
MYGYLNEPSPCSKTGCTSNMKFWNATTTTGLSTFTLDVG